MRAGEHDVDAESVHVDRDAGEGGNGIDDQRDIGIFRERAANLRQGIHHAGRGFAVNQDDGVEFSGGEPGIDLLWIDVFSPFDLERLGVFSAAFGDVEPFVGERAAHAAEHAAIDQVADRRLHYAPGG